MESGFLVDESRFAHDIQKWVQGPPKKGFLGSLAGELVAYDVLTFRCTKCGVLESYVPRVRAKARSRRSPS